MPAALAIDMDSVRREMVEPIYRRQTLRTIIQNFDLYRSERARMPMEDVLDLMRLQIDVKGAQPLTIPSPTPTRFWRSVSPEI